MYGGDEYYHRAAQRLKADCVSIGATHHIQEIDTDGLDWAQICRLKIPFYREMLERYDSILWVDSDTRLARLPTALRYCQADFGGFIGRRQYLRDYDSYETARFWIPSIIFFGASEATRRFVGQMTDLDARTHLNVTDDWILDETWKTHTEELNVLVLAPHLLARTSDDTSDNWSFLLGDSGHAPEFRSNVRQHQPTILKPELQSKAIGAASVKAMSRGERSDALILAKHAHSADPNDRKAALRLANYLSLTGDPSAGDDLLADYVKLHPNDVIARESLAHRLSQRGEFSRASEHQRALSANRDPDIALRGEALRYEIDLDIEASNQNVNRSSRPAVWWNRTPFPGHFSEVLKPWVVQQVLGIPPRRGTRANSILTGETPLAHAGANNVVWGGGLTTAHDTPSADTAILAVRGPRTRDAIVSGGGRCPNIFGDPARLLPTLIFPAPSDEPPAQLSLLRSASDLELTISLDGVHEINPIGTPPNIVHDVVMQIANSRGLLTTSLTALATAHAFGVPARWCIFSESPEGRLSDGEDFRDYFDAVGLEHQDPLDLSKHVAITKDLLIEVPQVGEIQNPAPDFAEILRHHFLRERATQGGNS